MKLNAQILISKFNLNNRPSLVIIFGFLAIILVGAYLLTLPFASAGKPVSFIDAYFTSTSAVCVTGLVVVDTGTTYSFWGKLIIMFLIQLGGLGYMTLSVFIMIMLKRKLLITHRLAVRDALNLFTSQGVIRLTKNIFLFVFIIESIGALLLFLRWLPLYGLKRAAFYGVFHSVSAFCNAGLDVIGNFKSLTEFRGDIFVNLVFMGLIIIGGIGFIVIQEIINRIIYKTQLSLHSKIVIWTTIFLILGGYILIALLEWNNPKTLGGIPLLDKHLGALFQSVTPRTAGFNTIDIAGLHPVTLFIILILMFIGASPGGTGGGVKTSTFALAVLTARSSILGRSSTEVFQRRIPNETVRKSFAIILLGLAVVISSTLLVSCFQNFKFIDVLFESTSAFGTVGLSTGLTPTLANINKIIIALTMFAGRIGPITFFLAITLFRGERKVKYLKEDVSIG